MRHFYGWIPIVPLVLGLATSVVLFICPKHVFAQEIPPSIKSDPDGEPSIRAKEAGDALSSYLRRFRAAISSHMRIEELDEAIDGHLDAVRFAEALVSARQKLDLLERVHGKGHWKSSDASRNVETLRQLSERPREVRERHLKARKLLANATKLFREDRRVEAVNIFRETLDIRRDVLGEEHPETADSYTFLGMALHTLGKYAEAEPLFRRAATIRHSVLGEAHPDLAIAYSNLAVTLAQQGKYAEAEVIHRRAFEIDLKAFGENDPRTAISCSNLASTVADRGRFVEAEALLRRSLASRLKSLGENHRDTAMSYSNLAVVLSDQAKYAEAEAMHRHALAIRLKLLGEIHTDVAVTCTNLASTLADQAKYTEAEAMCRRALAILIKIGGEDNPDAALSYNNLAAILGDTGRIVEAEAMYRRALAILKKALGERHRYTLAAYRNLAVVLDDQGKYVEAEMLHRLALEGHQLILGEDHPRTAHCHDALAGMLHAQGRYAEAEAAKRRALAILLKVLGESHPDTARSYLSLALTLDSRNNQAEAETMYRRALAIRLKALGESHPHTAQSYSSLASSLGIQERYAEAEPLLRRALEIHLKSPGDNLDLGFCYSALALNLGGQKRHAEAESLHRLASTTWAKGLGIEHPEVATSNNNLALNLHRQGKYAEAEELYRRVLAIRLKTLGNDHPATATTYNDLAWSLDFQGKFDDALLMWRKAVEIEARARLKEVKGLESGVLANASPLPSLAIALARAGESHQAWTNWEQSLARAIVEEVVGRSARPLSAEDREREDRLSSMAQFVEEHIGKVAALKAPSQEQIKLLNDLRRQESDLRRQSLELQQLLEAKYGALVGQSATLASVQKNLPDNTALIGWIDAGSYHWVCLLHCNDSPTWVRLTGSGKKGSWTRDEDELAQRLRVELSPETAKGNARPLAEALAKQRLDPLKDHLKGIKRLIVVNSPGMAGVPIEVLMAARPDPAWDGITVSYAPSASMYTYLKSKPVPTDRPPTLLALADPAYPAPKADAPAPTPPDSGIGIARVVPNSNADLNGLKDSDVMLAYSGVALTKHEDLKVVSPDSGPRKVPVKYWREGIVRDIEVAAGPLGVNIDDRPIKDFVRGRQAAQQILQGMGDGSHERLPGTRREVEAIAGLFPKERVKTIMGAEACETNVQELARSGQLKGFRYLHFAAHGESDPHNAYRSALILAPNPDKGDDPLALDSDGKITAEQIARTWELDADLVVLSACESGLGRAAGGEGYLGFSQPLFARGARSLVLSLWKVDDEPTALLMARFYANLLGKRDALKAPMPKSEALSEAKFWLRNASADEVGRSRAALPRGEIVRRQPVPKATADPARPYADPRFWAGFILVGAAD